MGSADSKSRILDGFCGVGGCGVGGLIYTSRDVISFHLLQPLHQDVPCRVRGSIMCPKSCPLGRPQYVWRIYFVEFYMVLWGRRIYFVEFYRVLWGRWIKNVEFYNVL